MFNIDEMPYVIESDGKPRYLFIDSNQETLNRDIATINKLLNNANLKFTNPLIPELNYGVNKNFKGPINYTFLWLNDNTPTGKAPKYVYTVYFNTFKGNYIKEWGNNTFGEIYYLPNGQMGKARIIIWRNKKLVVVHLKLIDNILSVSKVEYKK